ncbi:PREDICTED: uncharacterized protein LOC108771327 [Cyphomyrmex costatus]|uniref:uncharacterized protein LOC108771327 n=1 Tax=Cyphomyrmex costatus TaxID=456900 RepID=UPI0008521F5E|nr:PREDICTED: uncharacterized protein LOC108771327 [Cyphomyrmex costatus]
MTPQVSGSVTPCAPTDNSFGSASASCSTEGFVETFHPSSRNELEVFAMDIDEQRRQRSVHYQAQSKRNQIVSELVISAVHARVHLDANFVETTSILVKTVQNRYATRRPTTQNALIAKAKWDLTMKTAHMRTLLSRNSAPDCRGIRKPFLERKFHIRRLHLLPIQALLRLVHVSKVMMSLHTDKLFIGKPTDALILIIVTG